MKFLPKQRPCWNSSLVSNVSDATQPKCDLVSRGNYLLFTLLLGTINLSLRIRPGGGLFYVVNNAMCSCTIPPLGPRAGTRCAGWHHSWLAVNVLLFLLRVGEKKNEPILKKLSLRDTEFKMMYRIYMKTVVLGLFKHSKARMKPVYYVEIVYVFSSFTHDVSEFCCTL